jgi:hypothetical protein
MAAVLTGTSCLFGIDGAITDVFVQSYTVNATFNLSGTVADEQGLTKTARYDDRKTEITVEGVIKTSGMPTLGDALTFTINADTAYTSGSATVTYIGTITGISQKGTNKDFTTVSVTALVYQDVPAV